MGLKQLARRWLEIDDTPTPQHAPPPFSPSFIDEGEDKWEEEWDHTSGDQIDVPIYCPSTLYVTIKYHAHNMETEVGFIGITVSEEQDYYGDGVVIIPSSITIDEAIVMKQEATTTETDPDMVWYALQMQEWAKTDRSLADFARLWIHTHPRLDGTPSPQDLQTFEEGWDQKPWALMMIVPTHGPIYLKPGGKNAVYWRPRLVVEWEGRCIMTAEDYDKLDAEYRKKVTRKAHTPTIRSYLNGSTLPSSSSSPAETTARRFDDLDEADQYWRNREDARARLDREYAYALEHGVYPDDPQDLDFDARTAPELEGEGTSALECQPQAKRDGEADSKKKMP